VVTAAVGMGTVVLAVALLLGVAGAPAGSPSIGPRGPFPGLFPSGLERPRTAGADGGATSAVDGTGGASVPRGSYTVSSFTANPSTFELGTPTRSNTTLTVNTSGTLPALPTYQYWGLPPGCATADTPQLPCTPNGSGVFIVSVAVTDLLGDNATASLTLTVAPALSADPTAAPSVVDVSQPVRFSAGVTGGLGPFSYSWRFGDGAGATSAGPTHLFARSGTFTSTLWVNDSGAGSVERSTVVSVSNGPVVSLTASNPKPPVGSTLELDTTVNGGRAPYSYVYSGLPPDCTTVDGPTLHCLLLTAGLYSVGVTVTDATRAHANGSASVVVGFGFTLLLPAVVTLGQNFTIQVLVAGNYGPLTYDYAGLPVGCTPSTGSEVNCTPQGLGVSDVTVSVTDSLGDRASRSAQVDVVASTSAPLAFSAEILLAEIAVALAVFAVILLTASKRGRHPPRAGPEPARAPSVPPRAPPPGAFGPGGPPTSP
jgi:hypothetical protein